ncbi:MAG: OmpH family outer membrane protein [Deltaproteobacteria bacterium]|nr:OmpH family outer membrane protein [Deltaproteobacteria bacterium]MBW1737347.1 OmpH family outer membrane protein [Deltaproteobacteria bacterium]MBW1909560.1 OmpH family outer membrane protein [Deltaproteobacteria bacterium]MBW2033068.1 OmpH family outer membrane protein [Deltaproteobacteria bacterium]MBW2114337.1 OmpH family outer membrane protein [Deltaproteobacteria bacterium]
MKKYFGLFVVIVFVLCIQTHAFCADTYKIGVIDVMKLQEKSKAFQKVRKALREKFVALEEKLEKEKNEVIKLEQELKKQSMMLSLDAREDKRQDLEKKMRHFRYLQNETAEEAKSLELEARKKVIREIEKVVDKIGKKKGYIIIFERRTVGLIYYKDAIDLTDEVTEAYDKAMK